MPGIEVSNTSKPSILLYGACGSLHTVAVPTPKHSAVFPTMASKRMPYDVSVHQVHPPPTYGDYLGWAWMNTWTFQTTKCMMIDFLDESAIVGLTPATTHVLWVKTMLSH